MASSLVSFEELNPAAKIDSPRSLQACKQEGVLPQELIYRPIEAFQEKNLEPRLVKLRYDFFEAKRRDLLAAARRSRDAIVADERREKENNTNQLDVLSRDSGLTRGAILAIQSDGLKLERQKLLRAQENERNWLKNALNNELRQLKQLESDNEMLQQAASKDAESQKEKARLMKELNDKRQQEEERKAMEAEARQKLEKQIAKEEFHRQQEELQKKGELEALRQKEAYERQMKDMERKRLAEIEKAEKKEAAYREQEARRAEMRAQDLKRQDIMEQQKLKCLARARLLSTSRSSSSPSGIGMLSSSCMAPPMAFEAAAAAKTAGLTVTDGLPSFPELQGLRGPWLDAVLAASPHLNREGLLHVLSIIEKAIKNQKHASAMDELIRSADDSPGGSGSYVQSAACLRAQIDSEQSQLLRELQQMALHFGKPKVATVAAPATPVEVRTLSECLQSVTCFDPNCLCIARQINKLGPDASRVLEWHYSAYGSVVQILVPFSYNRRRPSSTGFILMDSPEAVKAILAAGLEQEVAGATVRIQKFERRPQAIGIAEQTPSASERSTGSGTDDSSAATSTGTAEKRYTRRLPWQTSRRMTASEAVMAQMQTKE